ncbi:fibronectin/fibrinogen binding-related protein, putative [Trichomonas vaginalis G3]|uniref:Fibronectin/fibrinogen binding-related protein, putative n=1 Tax=Trichomonas vaginalis (strain ATCC PRA-98 / G3) TaxID=412133 RepID=A2F1K7_TRIV3|nr:protein of unknown function (DUF814) [Trichomonas vaginalis G3]EAY01225.1 fibronectin/fibrinogen binding-related protein, putative [Trichomonas vaginalis G3]KAI5532495.1 protein of unknown function (DUF814) [Trichomonas vaginalis G3]|eukprot:XP_001330141.1 fibronectin/fibrinogen binding-related protein [Trichomonas vaginalis G3]
MRLFTSQTGLTIKVGENAKDNDKLIKTSHQDSLWCHLENLPSPHVVIDSSNPDTDTISDAYQLVKFFSKYKNSNQLRIISTKIRNVDRIDLSKPGLVHLKSSPNKKSIKTNVNTLRRLGLSAE